MKLNQEDKCNLKLGQTIIWESKKQKWLGVIIDNKLSFDEHVLNLCKNVGKSVL